MPTLVDAAFVATQLWTAAGKVGGDAPLSEKNSTSVLRSSPRLTSFSRICPTPSSIGSVMPRYFSMRSLSFAGFQRFQPSSSERRTGSPRTCTGLWIARCGMYRQNGPCLFRSMNSSAY